MQFPIKKIVTSHYFIAFFLGALCALSFAPTYLFFLSIIGFTGLFILLGECEKRKKQSFWTGWFFGFGHFIGGLYWISISLLVEPEKFAWLIPFAVSLIPAAAACYIGLTALIVNVISDRFSLNKSSKILLIAVFWVFFEYLRTYLFSGFPWNLLGYNIGFSITLSQIAYKIGIYGLSFVSVIICCIPALFISKKIKFEFDKKSLPLVIAAAITVISIWTYGYDRLANAKIELVKNGNVRLVQSAILQEEKWDAKSNYDSFYRNIELSKQKGLEKIDYLIWSETAVPYIVGDDSLKILDDMRQAIPRDGILITGALRARYDENNYALKQIWNSIFVVNDHGKIVEHYDKNHLVPFGEYIPFSKYLPFISKITNGSLNFSTGSGVKTIKLKNKASFGPLICYEIIFPHNVVDQKNRPDFLVNITNDTWFGTSSGPYQHLAMAQMRAIEYGIPIVRVANTGISALINPYGRIVKKLGLNEKGILDVELMKSIGSATSITKNP